MTEWNSVYKIVLKDGENIKTLYHGIRGSRSLEYNKWYDAELKNVRDGSVHNSREYLSGIHCFRSRKKAEEYLTRFRSNKERIVIRCRARGLRQKITNPDVYLADKLYIPQDLNE